MDSLSVLAMAAAAAPRSQVPHSVPNFSIRKARSEDIPLLGPVERSAAEIFRTVNLGSLADDETTVAPSILATMADSNHLLVAVNESDQPIGFVGGMDIDGNFHIVEISVAQAVQGKGVGSALMAEMTRQVKEEKFMVMTLTTYRNVAWNGPWYKKLGFQEVTAEEMGKEYLKIWDVESQHGHDMASRCVMRKSL
jgi:ribosomal protein S18 acetylase RimI-like enzyme